MQFSAAGNEHGVRKEHQACSPDAARNVPILSQFVAQSSKLKNLFFYITKDDKYSFWGLKKLDA